MLSTNLNSSLFFSPSLVGRVGVGLSAFSGGRHFFYAVLLVIWQKIRIFVPENIILYIITL